ncbi:phage exclusion protein Lit family protein [Phenylobacterium ferrooxidans]|uniref:Phage exclusion protein Lit family protein n=1 Tax=Phenylobacterium ferrooxidans TaxID=2982689 RepID=A0ABW6CQI7_9CAUL
MKAEPLIRAFDPPLGGVLFHAAPERQNELAGYLGSGFAGLELWDGPVNFWADAKDNIVRGSFSGLLSLWSACRAALLFADAGAQALRRSESVISANAPTVIEAWKLVGAADALIRDQAAEWPDDLVPPDTKAKDVASKAANNLFLFASAWALLHEIGHLKLEHSENVSADERKQQEVDADAFANHWLLQNCPPEHIEFRTFGVACAIAWLGLIDRVRRGSTTHPHASERLNRASALFDLKSESPSFEMTSYVLKAFFDPSTPLPDTEDTEEAFATVAAAWSQLER